MCTAIWTAGETPLFGRNLDLERSLGEKVTITPRHYVFQFGDGTVCERHEAIIGMAVVSRDCPLYFDAANESGLYMAALSFPGEAHYREPQGENELSPFELIPRVLTSCRTVGEAVTLLTGRYLVDRPFSDEFPNQPLHWLLSDGERSVAIEPLPDGLHLYENPFGVLTNSPAFPFHRWHVQLYRRLSPAEESGILCTDPPYSKGMGAFGLPGDASSASRFVRATFNRQNAVFEGTVLDRVGQFFHLLDSVAQVKGCNRTREGEEYTLYSSCYVPEKRTYYYTTYNNRQITAVTLDESSLKGTIPRIFPLQTTQKVYREH